MAYILLHIHLSVLLVTCPRAMLIPQMCLTLHFLSYKRGQCVFYVADTATVTHSNLEKGRLCEPVSLSHVSDRQAEILQRERKDTTDKAVCPSCIFSERHTRQR